MSNILDKIDKYLVSNEPLTIEEQEAYDDMMADEELLETLTKEEQRELREGAKARLAGAAAVAVGSNVAQYKLAQAWFERCAGQCRKKEGDAKKRCTEKCREGKAKRKAAAKKK